jgi:hypothetical protein
MEDVKEEVDGKMHMLKAVEGENCTGCAFSKMCQGSRLNNIHVCDREDDCPLEYSNTVVKDLGILNEDGCLPCPFCGEYPLVENAYEGVSGHNTPDGFWRISCFGKNHEMAFFSGKTRQQAIDAWNRRV